jgi:pyruvyltransferase
MTYQVFKKRARGRIKMMVMPFINGVISLFVKRPLYVNAWVEVNMGKVSHGNWGDDVNLNLVSLLTDKKPIIAPSIYPLFKKEKTNYTCIGSIIGLYDNKYTVVWGSGALAKDIVIQTKPKKICSVRGPQTRNLLLAQGIDCPEKFGDPALLISRFIRPSFKKKYKLGIIPHYKDFDNPAIVAYVHKHTDVLIIKMQGYSEWTDIPRQICQCEFIISSSLHGLIMADSYRVPNAWVRFSDKIAGGDFKYLDYFESVSRDTVSPFVIKKSDDIEQIVENNYFSIARFDKIDYRAIFETCPFKDSEKDYRKLIPKLPEYTSFPEKDDIYCQNEYINSETELDGLINRLQPLEDGLLFRGVNESKYKMFASSQRHWKQKTDWVARMGHDNYYSFVEDIIRRTECLDEVQQYMQQHNVHTNDMFLMALMQHFEAPSPMIDFSKNLLTGLFFASDWDDSMWTDSGNQEIGDYVSLYYISKGFDWVYATVQRIMQDAAKKLQEDINEVLNGGIILDTTTTEENIRRLLYRQFRLDSNQSDITFIPLGGPSLGSVKIDIPSINVHCEYEIINDRIVKQQGMFIMNNTVDEPLVEVMNKQSKQKMFCCVNIHKKLLPYLREKYLIPNNLIHDVVYENNKKEVVVISNAIKSLA